MKAFRHRSSYIIKSFDLLLAAIHFVHAGTHTRNVQGWQVCSGNHVYRAVYCPGDEAFAMGRQKVWHSTKTEAS